MNDQWLIKLVKEAMENRAERSRGLLCSYPRYLAEEVEQARKVWEPVPEAVKRAVRHEMTNPNDTYIFKMMEQRQTAGR